MKHEPRKKLGSNIRQLRRSQGLSQEKLAEKADLHRTYIGAIERGERNVSLDNIVAIAHALGVPASKLLEGVD
ncbi:helix-turn-helix domain-containing protein [Lyngbya sp. PCC 8106]|uniref:helix-turn-helix domain-containing protein n=1 Tax=Lyngbya sp. (strain PCC 8106) TaxID=313612 RepID=UPI0000EA9800|nr:helix-turn-helix transcriptional regulator [Lyngbya sp. PCC 8106]EAW36846.1 subunit S of type I restriction-modification system [Lyngbya sp. PCC 8106]